MTLWSCLVLALDVEKPVRAKQATDVPGLLSQSSHIRPVKQASIIKCFAREGANLWMHSILSVQEMDVFRMILPHAYEQALLVLKASRFFGKDGGWKLLRVADENCFSAAVLQGNEGAHFDTLCCFVDDD